MARAIATDVKIMFLYQEKKFGTKYEQNVTKFCHKVVTRVDKV